MEAREPNDALYGLEAIAKYLDTVLRPAMQQADVTEGLSERERNAFLMANPRLLAKELESANVTDGPAMTIDMRRKLGLPT